MRLLPLLIASVAGYIGTMATAASGGAIVVAAELTTKSARTDECNLGDLVADAIRAVRKSDIAFVSAVCLSDVTIPKGSATANDLANALANPDDNVVVVKLTGEQVRKAIEHGLNLYPQRNLALLQVSGITATVQQTADKPPKVVSIKVGKNPIEDTKTYTVAMPAPLANGHLAYTDIWSKADIDTDTGKSLGSAFSDYLTVNKTVGAKADERLVIRKTAGVAL